jgi:membrane protease YdiL (CAAX protease family)
MDLSSGITLVGGLAYVGFTIYLANYQQVTGERAALVRWLLFGVAGLTFMFALFILQMPMLQASADVQIPTIDSTAAGVNFVLTAVLCLFSVRIVASPELRARIRRRLPASATYNPESMVHTAAWVFMLAFVCITIGNFVVGGGISGLAQSLESSSIGLGDILFEDVLWVAAAALGIGLLLRRTPVQAAARLGLRWPTRADINWGIGVGILLFLFVIAVSYIWMRAVSPQELQQQTAASNQFAQAFNTVPVSLLLSIIVAIGEEIFFRGAIQPVFGIWVTSLFFAVIHTQYTLTPATAIIFVTSLVFGWLRNRYSTSASIIGHFMYNFIQLALAALGGASV